MKKFFYKFAVFISVIAILCIMSEISSIVFIRDLHTGSYLDKISTLEKIKGNKIVFLGGSATHFGIKSEFFEELSGVKSVNLGLNAAVPIYLYLQNVQRFLKKGDMLIVSPEYGYFSSDLLNTGDVALDLIRIDPFMRRYLPRDMFFKYWYNEILRSYARPIDYLHFKAYEMMGNRSIYVRNSSNKYGDFIGHKELKSLYKRQPSTFKSDINLNTTRKITECIRKIEKDGITVLICFPPYDAKRYTNYDEFYSFTYNFWKKSFGDRVIGTPMLFTYSSDSFFDTEYHLNYKASFLNTKKVYLLTKNKINISR